MKGKRFGSWEVLHSLGEGGMGSVYLAEHVESSRRVALKVIRARASSEEQVRFVSEVRTLGRIAHPAVVGVVDYGREDGRQWLAMDLVDGDTIAGFIRPGGLDAQIARTWFRRLAEALALIHELGVAHRDIKPANIVVGADGPVLVDFGVARTLSEKRLTVAGLIPGTPAYMAPEMFEVEDPDPLAADVYALAQVFCELLMGRTVCTVDERLSPNQQLGRIVSTKLELAECDPGEQVDDELRGIIRLATVADPARRPSARELCSLLGREEEDQRISTLSRPVSMPRPVSTAPRSREVWPLYAGLAAAGLLSILPTLTLGLGVPVYLMEELELTTAPTMGEMVGLVEEADSLADEVEAAGTDPVIDSSETAPIPEDQPEVVTEQTEASGVAAAPETSRRPASSGAGEAVRVADDAPRVHRAERAETDSESAPAGTAAPRAPRADQPGVRIACNDGDRCTLVDDAALNEALERASTLCPDGTLDCLRPRYVRPVLPRTF